MSRARTTSSTLLLALATAAACGGNPGDTNTTPDPVEVSPDNVTEVERQPPPDSGPRRDVRFPAIVRTEQPSGLEINTVEWDRLPIVYMALVIRSGGETDPANLPGLSSLVADMLKEGTRRRNSAALAEAVDFLGADLWTSASGENLVIGVRGLSEHFDDLLGILAEVTTQPRFDPRELDKLKRRERDRLALQENDPSFLSRRAFYRGLYGDHPYGQLDTTNAALDAVSRRDLSSWHQQFVRPNNASLLVVGNVDSNTVNEGVGRAFRTWRQGEIPETTYPEISRPASRQIIVVDRPDSVQSVIRIGNVAVPRSDENFISLMVANQVLGGSATSRLFQDLRQRRSLTYGAYSAVNETVDRGAFGASASVRTEVTEEAVGAFFEHLDRIVSEAPPAEELTAAQRYLSDRFPLRIDTPGKIVDLIMDLRVFGLPDDYWDGFRSAIGAVTPDQALAAARSNITPNQALVVVVGDASLIADSLTRFGPVRVVNAVGEVQRELPEQSAGSSSE